MIVAPDVDGMKFIKPFLQTNLPSAPLLELELDVPPPLELELELDPLPVKASDAHPIGLTKHFPNPIV